MKWKETAIQVRNATVNDVESIFKVRCCVTENHLSREELDELGVTPESVRDMIQGKEYVVPVALLKGKIVGFALGQISEGYLFAPVCSSRVRKQRNRSNSPGICRKRILSQ